MIVFVKKNKNLLTAAILCVLIAINCLLVSKSGAYAVFYNSPTRSLPIYSVKTDEKKLAISFDCAWGTDYTQELLDIMRENEIKATFFMTQFWVEKYPEYVLKIHEEGHCTATHSATHSKMSLQSKEEITSELNTSKEAIEKITKCPVTLFRPPFGDYDNLLIDTAKELNLWTIQWDVDSLDWKGLKADELALRIINKATNGSIILCHNNAEHIAEALPLIICDLKNKGYEFIRIDELIYKENYKIDANGRQYLTENAEKSGEKP